MFLFYVLLPNYLIKKAQNIPGSESGIPAMAGLAADPLAGLPGRVAGVYQATGRAQHGVPTPFLNAVYDHLVSFPGREMAGGGAVIGKIPITVNNQQKTLVLVGTAAHVLEHHLTIQQRTRDPHERSSENPFVAFAAGIPLQLIIYPRELPDIPGRSNQLGVSYTPGINLTRPTAVRLTIPSKNIVYLRHVPPKFGDVSIVGFVVDENVGVEVQTGEQPTSRKVDERLESFYSSQYHAWKEESFLTRQEPINPRQSIRWQPLPADEKSKVLATWLGNLQNHVPVIPLNQLKPGTQMIASTGGAFPSTSPFHSAPNITTATYDPSELREETEGMFLKGPDVAESKLPVIPISMQGWTSGPGQSGSPIFVRLKDGRIGLVGFTSRFNSSIMFPEMKQIEEQFRPIISKLQEDLIAAKTPEERARITKLLEDYEKLLMHAAENLAAKYSPAGYMSADPARKQMFRLHQQQIFSYSSPYFKLPGLSEPPSVIYVYPFQKSLTPDEQQTYLRNVADAVQKYLQRGPGLAPLQDDSWERGSDPTKVTTPVDKLPPPGDGGGLKAIPGAIKGLSEKLPKQIQKPPPPGNK